jgi:CrcB protein
MFTTVLQIALGGAIGATARFGFGLWVAFPFGTLLVNILGSLAMGVAFVLLSNKGFDRWMPLIMTGILGGFTTFSAFSLDTLKLIETGKMTTALGYVVASVVLSILALFAGVAVMRAIQP